MVYIITIGLCSILQSNDAHNFKEKHNNLFILWASKKKKKTLP
jgi:hypothetical protein